MGELISHASWMRDISDDTPVTALSIPGTHTHLEEAKRGDLKDLYITFSSAVGLKARGYAETINPLLNDYLAESPRGRVGIIAMDYFEEPRELVSNVIKMNHRSPTEDRRNS